MYTKDQKKERYILHYFNFADRIFDTLDDLDSFIMGELADFKYKCECGIMSYSNFEYWKEVYKNDVEVIREDYIRTKVLR